ncbi:MAG: phosphoenolpyruvate-utilizing N-terminal domain-containing protein, partial [Spirochaetales bacterium]|nr:phosphoenolpyruvate-utilizing N-terminal domain-containing protein [Spirochaetales bacterium]
MRELRGVAASPGAAIASAFLYSDDYSSAIPAYSIQSEDASEEFERYKEAVAQAKGEVKNLREKALTEAGEEQAAIFDAHLLMLDDPDVLEQVQERLHSTLMNVESIVFTLEQEMIDQLSSSQDPYIQERVSDVHDVIHRVLGHLLHRERFSLGDLENDVILVARDLLPSDMVGMARTKIRGIALEAGGRTS